MLDAVTIDDGEVRYRNRWVESKGLRAERARGMSLYGGYDGIRDAGAAHRGRRRLMKNVANAHHLPPMTGPR